MRLHDQLPCLKASMQPIRPSLPESGIRFPDNEPEQTVHARSRGVGRRRRTAAVRVGMIMANYCQAAPPRRTMSGKQNDRIDFEACAGIIGDVGGRTYFGDGARNTQQQAAYFVIRARVRLRHHPIV